MDTNHKNAAARITERNLLIALICLEIAFVMLFAVGTGLLPRP